MQGDELAVFYRKCKSGGGRATFSIIQSIEHLVAAQIFPDKER